MTASFLPLPFSDKVLWIKEIHVVEVPCLPLTCQKLTEDTVSVFRLVGEVPQEKFVQGHLCLRTEKSLISPMSGHGLVQM